MVMTLYKARLMILVFTSGRRLDDKAPLIDNSTDVTTVLLIYEPAQFGVDYKGQTGLSPPTATTQPRSREQTQVADSLSTTLMLTITTLIHRSSKDEHSKEI